MNLQVAGHAAASVKPWSRLMVQHMFETTQVHLSHVLYKNTFLSTKCVMSSKLSKTPEKCFSSLFNQRIESPNWLF